MHKIVLMLLLLSSPLAAEEWFNLQPRNIYSNPSAASQHTWEQLSRMEFTMSAGLTAGMHGTSHETMFALYQDFRILRKKQKGKNYFHPNRGMAAAKDLVFAFGLIDQFSRLENTKGHGLYGEFHSSFNATLRNTMLPRDALTLSVGYYGLGAWQPVLDGYLNTNIRLAERWGYDWITDLKALSVYFGPKLPVKPEAQEFGAELENMGYPFDIAMLIAWIAEEAGYKFNHGQAKKLILEAFRNNLFDSAPSLEDGADPFDGNQSGLSSLGVVWKEFGLSYSFGLTEWFNVGATVRYMRAQRMSSFSIINRISLEDFNITKAHGELRHNVGLDIGVTFMPSDNLTITLAGRNLNVPSFQWHNQKVVFQPQIRAGLNWQIASDIPVSFRAEMDLNRVESSLLRGLHHQQFAMGFVLSPEWENFGFTLGFGTSKNIGDSQESWTIDGHVGVKVWKVSLDVTGRTTFSTIYGLNSFIDWNIPKALGLNASLSIEFDF